MYRKILTLIATALTCATLCAQGRGGARIRENVPLDSIRLSDPFILADRKTKMYYMTGTGGKMWTSKNLVEWTGPYTVAAPDPNSWMGPNPMIWAAELHQRNGKYYYFATFTNRAVNIDTVANNVIERRACHVLVADNPMGPYVPMEHRYYLPQNKPTLDATLWYDTNKKPYMLYCHEWLQNLNGTVEKIELASDFSGTVGEGKILFRASDSPWSRADDDSDRPNVVTDGPFVFRTDKGRLGMIWTSWIRDIYTQGVAYSESGTLDGPWIQEPEPITPPNFGHGMIFRDFKGNNLMCIHSHAKRGEATIRIPHLFRVDLKGEKLKVLGEYIPKK